MSERKIRKMFKEGDRVVVKTENGSKKGMLLNLLASQYTIRYEDGNVDFFFYNEACPMTIDDNPSAVDDAATAMAESAAKKKPRKKTVRKRKT